MSGLDPQGCTPDLVRSHAVPVDVKELTAFLTGAKVLSDDAFISKAKRCIYVRVSVEATAAALSKDQKIDVTGTTLASGEIVAKEILVERSSPGPASSSAYSRHGGH